MVVGSDRDGELPLDLQFVSNLSDAKVGDRLVTSGLDSIFPRGITIGTLTKVEKGVGLYKRIGVTPAVDFAEVGAVLVVLDPPQITGPSPAGGAFATRPPAPTRPTAPAAGAATTPTPALQPGGRPSGAQPPTPAPAAPRPAATRPTPPPASQTPPAQTPPGPAPPVQTPPPTTAEPATAPPPPGRPR